MIDNSVKSVVVFNAIFNYFGGQAVMHVWALFRGLQSINNLNLIEVQYQGFSDKFFKSTMLISQVDMFYGEEITKKICSFNVS